jgi:hypothetical protein
VTSLIFKMTDNGQNPRTQIIFSIIHHRKNFLEYTCSYVNLSVTNSNPRSAGSSDQKFKLSSTTSNLEVPQATTSSRARSFRNTVNWLKLYV